MKTYKQVRATLLVNTGTSGATWTYYVDRQDGRLKQDFKAANGNVYTTSVNLEDAPNLVLEEYAKFMIGLLYS